MNSIDVKLEKANAIFRYRRLQNLTSLFRFIEMFVFFVLISKSSSQLPFAIRLSTEHFRGISFSIFSPSFVFVIGNIIVLILLFNSRVSGDLNGKLDVYDEYVKSCEKSVVNITNNVSTEIVPIEEKKICRSQSENLMIVNSKGNETRRKLRRSVTEKRCAAEELSGEEFRRTVEAFIARQQKSLRDEELS